MVDVTSATETVTVKAETLQHERALLYHEALEQALAEVRTVFGEGGEDGLVAGTRFLNTLYIGWGHQVLPSQCQNSFRSPTRLRQPA